MIKTLIVISLLSLTLCKPSHYCTEAGLYQCPENATCCKTLDESANGGFRCFPIENGNCCSGENNIGVCPSSTICDLPNKKCSYTSSRLLQVQEFIPPFDEYSFEPTQVGASLKEVDTGALVDGFLEGIAIFKGVTICKPVDKLEPLIQEIIDLKNIISKISDISKIKTAIDKFQVVFNKFKSSFKEISNDCGKSKDSIIKVINDLDEKIDSWTYAPLLLKHSIVESFNIVKKAKSLIEDWSKNKDFDNGKKIGELFKFVLFWDI